MEHGMKITSLPDHCPFYPFSFLFPISSDSTEKVSSKFHQAVQFSNALLN